MIPVNTVMSEGTEAAHATLRERAGWRSGTRECVLVEGPDALAYLQGQLSQDIAAMAIDSSAWSLLLQPQGRVDAWLRVSRLADDRFVLDVDAGHRGAMLKRLQRFLLRTDATIEPLEWSSLAIRGPRAADATIAVAEGVVAPASWGGVDGIDLLGPSPDDLLAAAQAAIPAMVEVDENTWNAVRILSGLPVMGADIDDDTIPEGAGIVGPSVSFTKGCYTGQELVARIDSRGSNVPKRLRLVTGPRGALFGSAEPILVDGDEVGRLTSTGVDPATGAPVALGWVARRVEVPTATATVASGSAADAAAMAVQIVAISDELPESE